MELSRLLHDCGITAARRESNDDPVVTDIVYDSRKVTPGALYVAIPGTRVDGDSFIGNAVANGAVAVLSERSHPECPVPCVQVTGIRGLLGIAGRVLWKVPTDSLQMVGITGTNGKTTVAHLFEELFASVKHDADVWMFGTIDYHLGAVRKAAPNTTPEALDIFRSIGTELRKPAAVVMEISSHSLALDRIGGLSFDLAVFTNLTQDHLDFHGSMEAYYLAKRRLFTEYLKAGGCAAVNIDDPFGRRLAEELDSARCTTFGRADDAAVRIIAWECDWDGCRVRMAISGTEYAFTSALRGFFNVYNMAALVAGATALGYGPETIQAAFDLVSSVNGRMDRVDLDASFAVVVDYAHTPDALHNVLKTAKEITRGRLLCVFGCGGDRDRTKRPLMGAAVAQWCDEGWVTSDNPRTEKPAAIISDIIDGIPLDFPHVVNPDRRAAIAAALREARSGDCLVIAGKGHETYQEIAGVRHHFDDKEVVTEEYAALITEATNHVAS